METLVGRSIEKRVLSMLEKYPAVMLIGARQVGKSTLAAKIAADRASVVYDLDEDEANSALRHSPAKTLLKHEGKLVVIDEIQRIPDLYRTLRHVIDAGIARGERNGKFLLLGSVVLEKRRQTETLAGRVHRMRMHGIGMHDIGPDGNMEHLWNVGGFPKSYIADSEQASREWINTYVGLQIGRELTSMESKVSANSLIKLLRLLAADQGGLANKARIANDLKISEPTVESHLSLLDRMMLISEVPYYASNHRKRVVKSPKIYVCDSGLANALCNISTIQASSSRDSGLLGASWEGFAVENIRSVLPQDWIIHHFRTYQGNEIDIVLELPKMKTWAVEIKYRSTALTKGNRKALSMLKSERAFLVHSGSSRFDTEDGVEVIPLADFLNELLACSDELPEVPGKHSNRAVGMQGFAALEHAVRNSSSSLQLLRVEFLDELWARVQKIIAASIGGNDDAGLRQEWILARNGLLRWLDLESKTVSALPDTLGWDASLKELLEKILAIKLSSASATASPGPSFAGLCCFDLFVHSVAILIRSGKFLKVHKLLSGDYMCRGDLHKSDTFGIRHPAGTKGALEFVASDPYVELERLVEAELVIAAFSLAQPASSGVGMLWLPQLLSGRKAASPLDFFLRAQTQEGAEWLLACIQDRGASRSIAQFMAAISSRLDELALDSSPDVDVRALRRALNIAKWYLLED